MCINSVGTLVFILIVACLVVCMFIVLVFSAWCYLCLSGWLFTFCWVCLNVWYLIAGGCRFVGRCCWLLWVCYLMCYIGWWRVVFECLGVGCAR